LVQNSVTYFMDGPKGLPENWYSDLTVLLVKADIVRVVLF